MKFYREKSYYYEFKNQHY